MEAKYRRSVLDVAILQDHIAFQRESVKKVQSDRIELRRCLRHTEQKLQHDTQDHRDVHSDVSRRYNAMQTEMTSKVQRMEKEVSQLSEQLVMCQQELSKETREREQVEREKDSVIADLQHQLEHMETDYEKILHENLDSLSSQLSAAQRGWEDESSAAHQKYEALLSEFGLNARNI